MRTNPNVVNGRSDRAGKPNEEYNSSDRRPKEKSLWQNLDPKLMDLATLTTEVNWVRII